MNLVEFTLASTTRGPCQCGRCIDAPPNPETLQPTGHTADLVFFKVSKNGDPSPGAFCALVQAEYPHWLDGEEHSFIQMGAEVGDQGLALLIMGLGAVLGVWKLLTPNTVMPFLDEPTKMALAGNGLVTIQATQSETP